MNGDIDMTETDLSRRLSFILRHRPDSVGISLDSHGWADVGELIAAISKQEPIDMELLERTVKTDDKSRYSFNADKTKIRANQGHSIPVDVELVLTPTPDMLWHGTAEKYEDGIDADGLVPKSRLYVHLSKDRDTAIKVGTRHGKPLLYAVDSASMQRDGFEFFLSVNGVWLVRCVPTKYLKKLRIECENEENQE